MLGNRVSVPPQGRATTLDELHSGHPGISQMRELGRAMAWWLYIDNDIEKVAKHCDT